MSSLTPSKITLEAFNDLLARYPSTAPANLHDLDELRYKTLPATLAQRKEDGKAYLEKENVVRLVEWKLKHGTFRPSLLALVQSNSAKLIEDTTSEAYELYNNNYRNDSGRTEVPPPFSCIVKPLKHLTTHLKGVGPATASLLLSVYEPEYVPFFSDEVFRWMMWEEEEGKGKGRGWKRMIKYTVKEYEELVRGAQKLCLRLEVAAVDVEKVAWVLGREGVDLDGEGGEVEVVEEERDEVEAKEDKEDVKPKKGVKRKTDDAKPAAEGLRRSKRKPGA